MNDDGGGSGETWSTLVAGVAGPPPNEFPGVLAPNRLVWRSQQAAVSVVAVYAYTTGLEFALFAFVPRIAVEEIADGLGGRRSSLGKLAFTVQGKPATVLNAEYREHTFRSHMWFSSRGHGDVVMGWSGRMRSSSGVSSLSEQRTSTRLAQGL